MPDDAFQQLAQAIIGGDSENAEAFANQVVGQCLDSHDCIKDRLNKGIQGVGELFANWEYQLPELINSADAMETALKVLEPSLTGDQKRELIDLVVLRPMEADHHENGKILIGTMLTDKDISDSHNIPILRWLS